MELLQDPHGAVDEFDDRPGLGADLALGQGIAVFIGDALEVAAGDAVPDGAVLVFLLGGAAAFEMEDYWRDPTVHYSLSPPMLLLIRSPDTEVLSSVSVGLLARTAAGRRVQHHAVEPVELRDLQRDIPTEQR